MSKQLKKKTPQSPGDAVLEVLNRKAPATRNGKRVKMSAFATALEKCFEKASRGDDDAVKALEQILAMSAFYEEAPEGAKHGMIVVYAPSPSKEAWLAEADATKLTINPLEGIPGAEEFNRDRKFRGGDDDDPTGN